MDYTRYNTKTVEHNNEFYTFKSPVPICKKCGKKVAIIDDFNLDKDVHTLMSYCPHCGDKHYMTMSHKIFRIYQLPIDECILYEKIYYQGAKE